MSKKAKAAVQGRVGEGRSQDGDARNGGERRPRSAFTLLNGVPAGPLSLLLIFSAPRVQLKPVHLALCLEAMPNGTR